VSNGNHAGRTTGGSPIGLLLRVALASLIPSVLFWVILTDSLRSIVEHQALADQMNTAEVILKTQGSSIFPASLPEQPLQPAQMMLFDRLIVPMFQTSNDGGLTVTIFNRSGRIIYSGNREYVGTFDRGNDMVADALRGESRYSFINAKKSRGITTEGNAASFVIPAKKNDVTIGAIEVIYSHRIALVDSRQQTKRLKMVVAIGIASLWAAAVAGAVLFAKRMNLRVDEQRQLATRDSLTGVANRLGFQSYLEAMLSSPRQGTVGLLIVDLNGFKPINDTYGHLTGDKVLQECADRLRSISRESDYVTRIGGDEFAIVIDAPTSAALDEFANRISARIAEPMDVDGTIITVSASVGTARAADDGTTPDELFSTADERMYRNKERQAVPR
jgi:diguanylate cyclase (GGDEF)-like protein